MDTPHAASLGTLHNRKCILGQSKLNILRPSGTVVWI